MHKCFENQSIVVDGVLLNTKNPSTASHCPYLTVSPKLVHFQTISG